MEESKRNSLTDSFSFFADISSSIMEDNNMKKIMLNVLTDLGKSLSILLVLLISLLLLSGCNVITKSTESTSLWSTGEFSAICEVTSNN